MEVLGIIPARGGSKGVPGKNIKQLAGKPLIAYTAHAATQSKRLSKTICSTDNQLIANIATQYGITVPFLRPAELATDSATAIPMLVHALDSIEALEKRKFDAVLMLQPTTPFRTADDIDGAIDLLLASGSDSVISVVDVQGHHPARMKYLEGDRLVDPPFCEAIENQPRQQLRPMYLRNGAIYLVQSNVLRKGSLKGRDCRAWIMPADRSVNIDTQEDYELAEWMLQRAIQQPELHG